ncbi:MAG: hypothetical protein BGO07_00600 [Alphaproteobacteria bacterium 40-19]|nr:MAG: hypothetical protein BGO07_00600 [Alphaproteobacteria bacterium 40-19]
MIRKILFLFFLSWAEPTQAHPKNLKSEEKTQKMNDILFSLALRNGDSLESLKSLIRVASPRALVGNFVYSKELQTMCLESEYLRWKLFESTFRIKDDVAQTAWLNYVLEEDSIDTKGAALVKNDLKGEKEAIFSSIVQAFDRKIRHHVKKEKLSSEDQFLPLAEQLIALEDGFICSRLKEALDFKDIDFYCQITECLDGYLSKLFCSKKKIISCFEETLKEFSTIALLVKFSVINEALSGHIQKILEDEKKCEALFDEVGQSGSYSAQGVLLILCAQSGVVSNRLKDIIDTKFNAPKYAVCIFNDVLKLGSCDQIPADSKQQTLKKDLLTPGAKKKVNNKALLRIEEFDYDDTRTEFSAFSELPGIEDFLPAYFKKEEDYPEENKGLCTGKNFALRLHLVLLCIRSGLSFSPWE